MSMNVGSDQGVSRARSPSINTTPLVDVMLVLLIIFLITIPVINKTVKVSLPKAVNIPTQTKPREHHHRGRQGKAISTGTTRWSRTARTYWPT